MRTKLSLTLEDANAMMVASLEAARAARRSVSVAIVDEAGGLLAFQRMDGARAYTIDLAQRKARASAMVGVATAIIEAMNRDRPPGSPEAAVSAGGLPAMHDGQCTGALGVSGGKPEEDEVIARAGLAVLASHPAAPAASG